MDGTILPARASTALLSRAFNSVRVDGDLVLKRSADRAKMRGEHDIYHVAPVELRRCLVPTFGYHETEAGAGYAMPHMPHPDAAKLWVTGKLQDKDAPVIVAAALAFSGILAPRPVPPRVALSRARALYIGKMEQRLAAFLASPVGRETDALVRDGTGWTGGLDEMAAETADRLEAAWDAGLLPCEERPCHGDPNLSNLLFDRKSGRGWLIDARGATSEAEIWGDPVYDLCKLSHSVAGRYDWINRGLSAVERRRDGRLTVVHHQTADNRAMLAALKVRVGARGLSWGLVRLCEATLFLSMLPLHAEAPTRCLGFALTAGQILDGEVEQAEAEEPLAAV